MLCFNGNEDPETADQQDPYQWQFYLVPVIGLGSAVTQSELDWVKQNVLAAGKPSSLVRPQKTLDKGIRGRPKIIPVGIEALTVEAIRDSLRLN